MQGRSDGTSDQARCQESERKHPNEVSNAEVAYVLAEFEY